MAEKLRKKVAMDQHHISRADTEATSSKRRGLSSNGTSPVRAFTRMPKLNGRSAVR